MATKTDFFFLTFEWCFRFLKKKNKFLILKAKFMWLLAKYLKIGTKAHKTIIYVWTIWKLLQLLFFIILNHKISNNKIILSTKKKSSAVFKMSLTFSNNFDRLNSYNVLIQHTFGNKFTLSKDDECFCDFILLWTSARCCVCK